MKHNNLLSHSFDAGKNAKLYEFLAKGQDIDYLATKIYSAKYSKTNNLQFQDKNDESA